MKKSIVSTMLAASLAMSGTSVFAAEATQTATPDTSNTTNTTSTTTPDTTSTTNTTNTPAPTQTNKVKEELKGLYNALKHVKNPVAREAILRNIAKHEAALKTQASTTAPATTGNTTTTTGDTVTVTPAPTQPTAPANPQINITIKINGNVIVFDQQPIVVEGRTLVPLRAIFEQLGVNTQWDAKTKTVKAAKGKKKMWLKIGERHANVDGKSLQLDQEARIVNGRTLVPLRFVSESLGAQVNWNGATSTVDIQASK